MPEAESKGKNEDAKEDSKDSSRESSDENLEKRIERSEDSGRKSDSNSQRGKVLYGKFNSKYSNSKNTDSENSKSKESKPKYQKKNTLYNKFVRYGKNLAAASLVALNSIGSSQAIQPNEHDVKQYHEQSGQSSPHSGAYEQRTIHGAVGIIYHQMEDGRVFFLLEENSPDYALVEYRGKLRCIGGSVNADDKSFKAAFVREINEEVASKDAKNSIIETVAENPKVYTIREYDVKGQTAYSVYFDVNLKSKNYWEAASSSRSTHDAGPFRIVSLDEILTMPDESFAFDEGRILKSFASNLRGGASAGHHKSLEFKTENPYNMNSFPAKTCTPGFKYV